MKHILVILSIALLLPYAKGQNRSENIWCFGNNAGLNFNSGSPVSVSGSAMATNSGCASIADKNTGNLLFYSDGVHVWDAANTIMPSDTAASGLGGSTNSSQSALIVPYPGSSSKYYLFTVDDLTDYYEGGDGNGGVSFSVIDMSLNGGLGDISQQPVMLVSPTCEKLAAVSMPNDSGYWVVVHVFASEVFFAFPVTAAGIGGSVASVKGQFVGTYDYYGDSYTQATGCMKISPDGSKIAVANYGNHAVQAFDFNDTTGMLTTKILSDTISITTGPYGISFSPNSQLLYATVEGDANIYQYDLTAGSLQAIQASRNIVGTTNSPWSLQLGPDEKLYVDNNYNYSQYRYIDRINDPNVYGSGSNFEAQAVHIDYGYPVYGLPNFAINLQGPVKYTLTYSNCSADTTITFADTLIDGIVTCSWNFSDPATGAADSSSLVATAHSFSGSGTYTVTLNINSDNGSFSIVKNINAQGQAPVLQVSANASICANDSTQLSASSASTVQYSWWPATGLSCVSCAGPFASPNSSTKYYVQATDSSGCTASDSVSVNVSSFQPQITTHGDTLIANGALAYQWFLNEMPIANATLGTYIATQSGSYTVEATGNNGCSGVSNPDVYTGMDAISENGNISIYPNPLSVGSWQLAVGNECIGAQLEVLDADGRVVYKSEIKNLRSEINASFPGGIYLLRITTDSGVVVRKLVKL